MENQAEVADGMCRARVQDRVDLIRGLYVDCWHTDYGDRYAFSWDNRFRVELGHAMGYRAAMSWLDGYMAGCNRMAQMVAGVCSNGLVTGELYDKESATKESSKNQTEEERV